MLYLRNWGKEAASFFRKGPHGTRRGWKIFRGIRQSVGNLRFFFEIVRLFRHPKIDASLSGKVVPGLEPNIAISFGTRFAMKEMNEFDFVRAEKKIPKIAIIW